MSAFKVRLRMAWDRNRPLLGYWLIFLALLSAFHASLTVGERFWTAIDVATAELLAWSLTLLGHEATADRTIVTSSLYVVTIVRECTGVHPIAIFMSAVVAYPLAWKARVLGMTLGIPVLLVINQVRLVSLCYIGSRYPVRLQVAHILVWQSLFVLFTVLLFLAWVLLAERRPSTASVATRTGT